MGFNSAIYFLCLHIVQIGTPSLRPPVRDTETVARVVGKGVLVSNFALTVRISDVTDCAAVVDEHRVELHGRGYQVVGWSSAATWKNERAGRICRFHLASYYKYILLRSFL